MTEKKKTLAGALLDAQRAIDNVAPDARNQHHGYSYASAEAIIRASRQALNGADLTVWPRTWAVETIPEGFPDKGFGATDAMLHVTFVLEHGPSGESRDHPLAFPVHAGKGRPLDKGFAASLTTATGYFLRGLLNIPRVDKSDDINTRDDREPAPRAKPPPAERKQGPVTIRNKKPGPCAICGEDVEEMKGWARREGKNQPWLTYHDSCAREAKEKREAGPPPEDINPETGEVLPADEGPNPGDVL